MGKLKKVSCHTPVTSLSHTQSTGLRESTQLRKSSWVQWTPVDSSGLSHYEDLMKWTDLAESPLESSGVHMEYGGDCNALPDTSQAPGFY